ncbi:Hypothetical predicted protein [Marmota monax]|uniref:Uncharacterized protein n=1 Tax=Marmota monax TaxID=9995 RepID=A0A5E4D5W4_MARMO|nr:Hypothetical predicted protein [Marmota monax]
MRGSENRQEKGVHLSNFINDLRPRRQLRGGLGTLVSGQVNRRPPPERMKEETVDETGADLNQQVTR